MGDERYTRGEYLASNPDWHDEDASWKAVQIAAFLRGTGINPASICDIGCGAGGVLAALAPLFPDARLVGYDISPGAKELADAQHPEIGVRLGDVLDSDDHFDLSMMIDVFEHVEDYLGFLRARRGVGDHLLCHIPLDMNVLAVWRDHRIVAVRENVGHLHYFNRYSAISTLRDAGYEVVATRYTTWGTQIPVVGAKQKAIQGLMRIGYSVSPDSTARILGGASLLALARPAR